MSISGSLNLDAFENLVLFCLALSLLERSFLSSISGSLNLASLENLTFLSLALSFLDSNSLSSISGSLNLSALENLQSSYLACSLSMRFKFYSVSLRVLGAGFVDFFITAQDGTS